MFKNNTFTKIGSMILAKVMAFKTILYILGIIIVSVCLRDIIPQDIKIFFFTISNLMRKILMFCLPFLVFPFMVTSISAIRFSSTYLIVGILALIIVSNFASIMIAYVVGSNIIPFLGLNEIIHIDTSIELHPIFDIALQPLVEIEVTMIIAFIVGLILGYYNNRKILDFFNSYTSFATGFFQKIFVPLLPIYILGTFLKISHELDFQYLLPSFCSMILMIVGTQLSYITILFFVGANFNFSNAIQAIRNACPAGLIGFSTMSSVVTMPVTMQAAEKNIENTKIARIAISSTVNCHDIGECISLPMIALSIFYLTFLHFPDFTTYATFAFFVSLAQFSGVGVPGGSIILILPFLTKYLNFDSDMSSLIIALSILMDPIGTCNNVMGNSAFAMVINRIYIKVSNAWNTYRTDKSIYADTAD